MLFALRQLWLSGQIAAGSKVVAVHTGGLQGLRGYTQVP
jgi:1-aminocyclopropane-1-carboxylate deaminase/D-cysteine desulfhydrase-like pyridoxal-dependent ACC family enzyme